MSKKVTGIQFSYQKGNNHVFGVSRIPQDISLKEATQMVNELKARFLYDDINFKSIED
ncbi:MAG: hypothetical protein GY853_16035 [PVC group bacterium]|nr:hypothetical protein [PVC group bacterium]